MKKLLKYMENTNSTIFLIFFVFFFGITPLKHVKTSLNFHTIIIIKQRPFVGGNGWGELRPHAIQF